MLFLEILGDFRWIREPHVFSKFTKLTFYIFNSFSFSLVQEVLSISGHISSKARLISFVRTHHSLVVLSNHEMEACFFQSTSWLKEKFNASIT